MANVYDSFIAKYKDFPQELAKLIQNNGEELSVVFVGDENYNLGTMSKTGSNNIRLVSAVNFLQAFEKYKTQNPQMLDDEARARVVYDFLAQNGINFSYENNGDDVLFDNVTRNDFYANYVFQSSVANTDYFDKHIGDLQIITLPEIATDKLPRNTEGLSSDILERLKTIPDDERLEIFYKRGLYHEAVHTGLKTTDERKCDAFALLKIMQEHPKYAETIFETYNMARSKVGYSLLTLKESARFSEQFSAKIAQGTMTYLMPKTYEKLKECALNPEKIPANDLEILKLTCELTNEPEFTKEELKEFKQMLEQRYITKDDLADSSVISACMKQGGFVSIDDYLAHDRVLKDKFPQSEQNNNIEEKTSLFMDRFIDGVRESHQSIDTYKRTIGNGISYTESSQRYKNFALKLITKEISTLNEKPLANVEKNIDNYINDEVVFNYMYNKDTLKSKKYFQLYKASQSDEVKKNEFNEFKRDILDNLSEVQRCALTNEVIRSKLVPMHANVKMRAEVQSEGGYCLKAITHILENTDKEINLGDYTGAILPQDFISQINNDEIAKDYIHHTDNNGSTRDFKTIIDEEGIKPGAIIILQNASGRAKHAMFWDGSRDESTREPLLIGFNGIGVTEESNVVASTAKNGNVRCGYIIDIASIVKASYTRNLKTKNNDKTKSITSQNNNSKSR